MKSLIFFLLIYSVFTSAALALEKSFKEFSTSLKNCLEKDEQHCIMKFIRQNSLTARGKFRCRKEDDYHFSQPELLRCLEKSNGELKSSIKDCIKMSSQNKKISSPYFVDAESSSTICIFLHFNEHWYLEQVLVKEETQ